MTPYKKISAVFDPIRRSAEVKKNASSFLTAACEYFHLSEAEYEKLLSNQTTAWTFFAHHIDQRSFDSDLIKKLSLIIHCDENGIRKIFLSTPEIFAIPPEQVEKNINQIVTSFEKEGLTKEMFLDLALKNPDILGRNTENVEQNLRKLVEHFQKDGLTVKKYLQLACQHTQLFSLKETKAEENISMCSKLLGIDQKKMVQLALINPVFFFQNSEKTKEKFLRLKEYFNNENITDLDITRMILQNPSILSAQPESLISKINQIVSFFAKEGLTTKNYVKAILKQPNILNLKPETIQNNLLKVVSMFQRDGISVPEYLKCAIKDPALFYRKPETVEKSIASVVQYFKKDGLTLREYLAAAKKMPILFRQASDTTIRHAEKIKKILLDNRLLQSSTKVWEFICLNPITLSYSEENLDLRDYVIALMQENNKKPPISTLSVKKGDLLKKMMALNGISEGTVNTFLKEEEKKEGKKFSKQIRTEKSIGLVVRLHKANLENENKKTLMNLLVLYDKAPEK